MSTGVYCSTFSAQEIGGSIGPEESCRVSPKRSAFLRVAVHVVDRLALDQVLLRAQFFSLFDIIPPHATHLFIYLRVENGPIRGSNPTGT
jgi:hypothetical protein